MTIKRTYECNLCRQEIKPVTTDDKPDGWGLSWCGPGNAYPLLGATLEPCGAWADQPIHLCQVCVRAVGVFMESAKKAGELIEA